MSRTSRTMPTDGDHGPHQKFLVKTRDGKRTMVKELQRDNRVTGLREQKRDRAETRQELRDISEEKDTVRNGKVRRYSNRHGIYLW